MKSITRLKIYSQFVFILLIQTCAFTAQPGKTIIREYEKSFRTYPYNDPDPVVSMNKIYPYFKFDGFTNTPINRKWKIIELENSFIKVFIAPGIGGKVLGAVEKSTGKQFLYYNPVVKFRNIGMRGPWTSGGIEYNFGTIGHAPTTSSSVDYFKRENSDGSASCFLGAMDLSSRTYWTVEIRLLPDTASFQMSSQWHNPTDMNTSLYHWMNAAVDATPGMELDFPGRHHINHSGEVFSWPVDEKGRRINIYGNNNFGNDKSYHVLGAYSDFYGGYWPQQGFGFGHLARYDKKPGKKIWIWALSQMGRIWIPLLTDPSEKDQYVEIQSGLLLNQAGSGSSFSPFKHRFFPSCSAVTFTESWFPVKGIHHLTGADSRLAYYVDIKGSHLLFRICPLRKVSGNLLVKQNNLVIYSNFTRLEPLKPIELNLNLPLKVTGDNANRHKTGNEAVSVLLSNKLVWSNRDAEERLLHRPLKIDPGFKWNSLYGQYTEAVEFEKQREYEKAFTKYRECLVKDEFFAPALTGIAGIYYRRLQYDSALKNLDRVLSLDAYDPHANYIYGLVNKALGQKYDALDGFQMASKSTTFSYPGKLQMAAIYLRDKNWDKAVEYSTEALKYNSDGIEARKLLVLAYRHGMQKKQEARMIVNQILGFDPLDHFSLFEKYLDDSSPQSLENFKGRIRNEFPNETYLELAVYYFDNNLPGDALKVLMMSPDNPIADYWLAWMNHLKGDEKRAKTYLGRALNLPVSLVFPFRAETIQPLAWALQEKNDWKTDYYLGLTWWSKGRKEKASAYFKACGDHPDFSYFYLTRSLLLSNSKDYNREKDLLKALELNSGNWRAYMMIIQFYNSLKNYGKALEYAKKAVSSFKDNYLLSTELAKTLFYNGDFKGCTDLLKNTLILPYEGARYGRDLYRMANIYQAFDAVASGKYLAACAKLKESRKYPENLGTGRPYLPDERIEDFLEGFCRKKLGEEDKSKALLNKVIKYSFGFKGTWNSADFLCAMALKSTGHENEGKKLLEKWYRKDPGKLTVQWARAMWNKKIRNAKSIAARLKSSGKGTPWSPSSADNNFKLIVDMFDKLQFE